MKIVHEITIRGAAMRLKKKWPRLSRRLMMILDDSEMCNHEFPVSAVEKRDDGSVDWACRKCSHVFTLSHPLHAPGRIVFDVFEDMGVKQV